MSSTGFEAVLVPAPGLRKVLLAICGGAWLTGTLLVLWLPVRPELKVMLLCLWQVRCLLEMRSQARGISRIDRIRICPAGQLQGSDKSGAMASLTLRSGSLVLSRIAWLRLRFADGLEYGELLTGNPQRDEQWRRLQVIWRQPGESFGGPRVS